MLTYLLKKLGIIKEETKYQNSNNKYKPPPKVTGKPRVIAHRYPKDLVGKNDMHKPMVFQPNRSTPYDPKDISTSKETPNCESKDDCSGSTSTKKQ